jgi:hypothetical protein
VNAEEKLALVLHRNCLIPWKNPGSGELVSIYSEGCQPNAFFEDTADSIPR